LVGALAHFSQFSRTAACGVTVLLLAACATTPQDEVNRQMHAYANLLAGAEMTASEWQSGNLPDQFAERALDSSADELSTGLGRISAAALKSGVPPQFILSTPEEALLRFEEMRQAVTGADRNALPARITALDEIRRQLPAGGA
jgi:hypothetical protein